MRVKHQRRRPARILGAALLVSLGILAGERLRQGLARRHAAARLDDLQQAVSAEDADAALWLRYARALQAAGRHAHAAQAFRRAADLDPYLPDARLGLAVSLAETGDAGQLLDAMTALVMVDARLALEVLARPEVTRYANHPGFSELLAEARSQAVD